MTITFTPLPRLHSGSLNVRYNVICYNGASFDLAGMIEREEWINGMPSNSFLKAAIHFKRFLLLPSKRHVLLLRRI